MITTDICFSTVGYSLITKSWTFVETIKEINAEIFNIKSDNIAKCIISLTSYCMCQMVKMSKYKCIIFFLNGGAKELITGGFCSDW